MRYVEIDGGQTLFNLRTLEKYKNDKNCFVTFTDLPKVGMNPKTTYGTPLGIYCYPVKYAYDTLTKNLDFNDLPFSRAKYIHILRSTSSNIPLDNKANLESYNRIKRLLLELYNKNKEKLNRKMTIYGNSIEIKKFQDIISFANTIAKEYLTYHMIKGKLNAFCKIWFLTFVFSVLMNSPQDKYGSYHDDKYKYHVYYWNWLLRYLGYEVVIDNGEGIIHYNEPCQAIFLTKSAFEHIELLDHRKYKIEKTNQPSTDRIVKDIHNKLYSIYDLPKNFEYEGYLSFNNTNIQKLPDNLTVHGCLDLRHTHRLKELPKNLHVSTELYLDDTIIKEIPDNTYIGYNLELPETIEKLGKNIYIGGDLILRRKIKLPDDLIVKGEILKEPRFK